MKRWQRKFQRDIDKRLSYVTNAELARSLCNVVIWYGLRNPEVQTDIEAAKSALEYLRPAYGSRSSVETCSIDRNRQGFKLKVWHMGAGYTFVHVTTRGLPPVPTTYEEEHAA